MLLSGGPVGPGETRRGRVTICNALFDVGPFTRAVVRRQYREARRVRGMARFDAKMISMGLLTCAGTMVAVNVAQVRR